MEYSIKDTQPNVSMKPIVSDELNPFKFKEDKSVRFRCCKIRICRYDRLKI